MLKNGDSTVQVETRLILKLEFTLRFAFYYILQFRYKRESPFGKATLHSSNIPIIDFCFVAYGFQRFMSSCRGSTDGGWSERRTGRWRRITDWKPYLDGNLEAFKTAARFSKCMPWRMYMMEAAANPPPLQTRVMTEGPSAESGC